MTHDKLTTLKSIVEALNKGSVSSDQLRNIARSILLIVKETRDTLRTESTANKKEIMTALAGAQRQLQAFEKSLKDGIDGEKKARSQELTTLQKTLLRKVENIEETLGNIDLEALEKRATADLPALKEVIETIQATQAEADLLATQNLETLRKEIQEAREVRVVAPSRGFFVYIDGVKKGLINSINFKAGSNMAISHAKVNGLDTVTFTASGGAGGLTIETPTGTVNGANATFGVSDEPQYVIGDGTTYFAGAGYTYSAPNITMDIAPSQYIRAII